MMFKGNSKARTTSPSTAFLMTMLALIVIPFQTACSNQKAAKVSTNKKKESGEKKSALPVVNPAFPGKYETVEVDGKELLQGRFPSGQFGGTLSRAMIASDPKTFNPWVSTDVTSSLLGQMMFASLMFTDQYNGEVSPYMAKSFSVADDGITYTTTLRKGLTWSDGKPITSADVEFTWNTIIAKGYGNQSLRDVTTIDGIPAKVTSVDKLTNKYVTPKQFAPFLRVLGDIQIAPKHIIEPILKSKNGRKKFMALWGSSVKPKSIVTSGPFTLSRFVPSQRVEFKRTKNFFMVNKDGKQLPYLDKIVYNFVPNVSTNLLKFKGGELDITRVRNRDTAELLKEREKGNFSLYNLGQDIGTSFMMFNMNRRKNPKTKKAYVDPVKSAWFNDLNFRQAVNHAINRKSIVANYFRGLAYPTFTTISPVSPFFNNKLKRFKSDLKLSMELLEKSGFKKNSEGELLDKDGNRVEFDLVAGAGGSYYQAAADIISTNLKELGIKVNYQELDFRILIDKTHNSLDWQAMIYGLSGGDPFEPNGGANVFRSNGRLHIYDQRLPDKNGTIKVTDARDWETRIDEIFSKAALTLDKAERKELYDEFQEIMYKNAPFIYLCGPMNIVGARNTIQNFQPTQLSQLSSGLHNISEIWMKDKSQEENNTNENKK